MPLTTANRVDYNLLLSVALLIVLRHSGVTHPCVDADDPSAKYGSKWTCCLEKLRSIFQDGVCCQDGTRLMCLVFNLFEFVSCCDTACSAWKVWCFSSEKLNVHDADLPLNYLCVCVCCMYWPRLHTNLSQHAEMLEAFLSQASILSVTLMTWIFYSNRLLLHWLQHRGMEVSVACPLISLAAKGVKKHVGSRVWKAGLLRPLEAGIIVDMPVPDVPDEEIFAHTCISPSTRGELLDFIRCCFSSSSFFSCPPRTLPAHERSVHCRIWTARVRSL